MLSRKKNYLQRFIFLVTLVMVAFFVFRAIHWATADSFADLQASNAGYLLEEVFPSNTWFWLSVSTLDEEQRSAYQALVPRFTDDPGALKNRLIQGIDENLSSVDLSYLNDIEPILGADGFRFAFGLSEDGDGEVVVHAGVTLRDPAKATELFASLEREGRFLKKSRDDFEIYYNVYAEQQSQENPDVVVYHFAVYEDLFLVGSSEDALADMLNRARSTGDESLWTHPDYQKVLDEIPARHVGFVYLDSQEIQERRAAAGSSSIGSNTLDYLLAQGVAVGLKDEQVWFDGIALGDREQLKIDDTGLDRLHAKNRYLYKDIPAQSIVAYFESYNLALELAEGLSEMGESQNGFLTYLQQALSIPQEDLGRFLSEGYGLAVHRNTGFLPGITVMADVSDGSLTAQTLLDAIDAQLSSLIGLFKFQGGVLAEAITKEMQETSIGTLNVIRLDVDSVLSLYDSSAGSSFALPAALSGLEVVLSYGITDDDRFLISSYEGWLNAPSVYLSDDAIYQEATQALEEYKEGLFFVDFNELMRYLVEFQSFREALRADAVLLQEELNLFDEATSDSESVTLTEDAATAATDTAISASSTGEDASVTASFEEPTEVEAAEAFDEWLNLLGPLKSFALSSEADTYEIGVHGVLLLDAQ